MSSRASAGRTSSWKHRSWRSVRSLRKAMSGVLGARIPLSQQSMNPPSPRASADRRGPGRECAREILGSRDSEAFETVSWSGAVPSTNSCTDRRLTPARVARSRWISPARLRWGRSSPVKRLPLVRGGHARPKATAEPCALWTEPLLLLGSESLETEEWPSEPGARRSFSWGAGRREAPCLDAYPRRLARDPEIQATSASMFTTSSTGPSERVVVHRTA
jgi:hypothetical protein